MPIKRMKSAGSLYEAIEHINALVEVVNALEIKVKEMDEEVDILVDALVQGTHGSLDS